MAQYRAIFGARVMIFNIKIPTSFVIAVVGAIFTMATWFISHELSTGMGTAFMVLAAGRFIYECDSDLG